MRATGRVAFLLAAAALAALRPAAPGAGHAALQPRIVNGTLTAAFPSTALLLSRDAGAAGSVGGSGVAECTATLVGCRTVLTAAHCMCGQDGSGATCAPRATDYAVFLQHAGLFPVESVAVHPAFGFPDADLAVLRLASPVSGVTPSPLAATAPLVGSTATVVGFGRSGGATDDYGLKRVGTVVLTDCATQGLSNDVALCFDYPPSASNTCNGDSGGPLFVEAGGGLALAGVTSGGTSTDCGAGGSGDRSWDTSVAPYAAWIAQQTDDAVGAAACGPGPQAGGADTTAVAIAGELGATAVGTTHQVDVPAGAARLVVTMNAEETWSFANFDLLAQAGREPSGGDDACAGLGRQPNQYAACEIANPAPGPWFLRVVRVRGAGRYQLTATAFGTGTASACGDGVRNGDEVCDGADAGTCANGCTAACTCAALPPCASARVDVRRLATRGRLAVSARLRDSGGDLVGLDPTRADLVIGLDDGTTRVQVAIPADDPGWARSTPARGVWRWRGRLDGLRAVRLRDRTARRGVWIARIRGRLAAGAGGLDPRRARLTVSLGGRCVAE